MKVTTVLGSPRKNGNTAAVLASFETLASVEHQVERIHVTDYAINGCLGCDACQKVQDAPACVQRDDAEALLQRLINADVIVYATPLYVWGFSAQMKALMDRHYCLVKWMNGQAVNALMKGKRVALLVTCGDAVEKNADLIQETFDREMRYLGCTVVGKYIIPHCTTPDQLGDKGMRTAQEMWDDVRCGGKTIS